MQIKVTKYLKGWEDIVSFQIIRDLICFRLKMDNKLLLIALILKIAGQVIATNKWVVHVFLNAKLLIAFILVS